MEYAACIGGRAVADGNKHPAPPTFRQFVSPKVFGVMKKNRENEVKIEKLRKRLSISGGGGGGQFNNRISIHDTIGSARQFVTDSLPYMRSVIPEGKLLFSKSTFHLSCVRIVSPGMQACVLSWLLTCFQPQM